MVKKVTGVKRRRIWVRKQDPPHNEQQNNPNLNKQQGEGENEAGDVDLVQEEALAGMVQDSGEILEASLASGMNLPLVISDLSQAEEGSEGENVVNIEMEKKSREEELRSLKVVRKGEQNKEEMHGGEDAVVQQTEAGMKQEQKAMERHKM